MFLFRREINALIEELAPMLLWVLGLMVLVVVIF